MSRFNRIFLYRCKAVFAKPALLLCLAVASALSVGMGAARISASQDALRHPVAIVNEDKGVLSQELLTALGSMNTMKLLVTDHDTAFRQLARGAVDGVFELSPQFTDTLQRGEYENTVSLTVASAASPARPLSEAVTSEVLKLWLREVTVKEMTVIAQERNTGEDAAALRARTLKSLDASLLQQGILSLHRTETGGAPEAQAGQTPLQAACGWFGALALFALLLSSNWALELRGNALAQRLRSSNLPRAAVFAASALATAAVCLGFWAASLCVLAGPAGISAAQALLSLAWMAVYLAGAAGMALCVSALVTRPVQLFMVAPAMVIANGVLGELLLRFSAALAPPQWLSAALPGKWLCMAVESPDAALMLCAVSLIWLAAGLAVSSMRRNKVG